MNDICDIVLARNPAQNMQVIYQGRKACAVVVHNALLIIKETFDRERERLRQETERKIVTAEPKIIIPGQRPPKLN
jgi:hypothetical protein